MTDPFDVINKMSGGDPPPTSHPRADFDVAALFGDAAAGGQNIEKPNDAALAETSTGGDEEDEDEQDRLPLRESDLDTPQLEVLWYFLEGWRETFPAISRAWPPCWVRHRALRQEALALAATWQLVEWKKLAPTSWLDELERSLHRCLQLWSSGCDENYHRDDESVATIQAASRAWLDQERTERAQPAPTGPTAPAGSAAGQPQGSALAQRLAPSAPAGQ